MRILVVGAGKMGRDVGLRFLHAGLDVTWFEIDDAGREAFDRRLRRETRRAADEHETLGHAEVLPPGAACEPFDALFEAVDESLASKRSVVEAWAPRLRGDALVLSNASSILPSAIDPRCLGFHAFYPVALTGFCEVVVPDGCPTERRLAAVALAARAALRPIVQDETRAFAVNRLMLPVQDWAMRAVRAGADPAAVDAAAVARWPSWEPLAMIDAIGIETASAAVLQYRSRMALDDAASFAALSEGLDALLEAGKRGARAGDGLRQGGPLPWGATGDPEPDLGADLEALFRNACARALATRDLAPGDLSLALTGLFGVPYRPADGNLLTPEALERCERRASTGLAYWRPAPHAEGIEDPVSGDGH